MIDTVDIHSTRLRRTLEIWALLQSGQAVTADFLADRFGCSRRTIFRDLDLLKRVGVGLRYENHSGGYAIPNDQRNSYFGLNPEELEALVLAATVSPVVQLSAFAKNLRQAISKLIPASWRVAGKDANHVARCFSFASSHAIVSAQQQAVLNLVVQAVDRCERLHITYSQNGLSGHRTTLSPYQVSYCDHDWAIVGLSSLHGTTKRFFLRGIETAELTGDYYELPTHDHSESSLPSPNKLSPSVRFPAAHGPQLSTTGT